MEKGLEKFPKEVAVDTTQGTLFDKSHLDGGKIMIVITVLPLVRFPACI